MPEAREFFVPPARFAARLELPAPVLQAEHALFAARAPARPDGGFPRRAPGRGAGFFPRAAARGRAGHRSEGRARHARPRRGAFRAPAARAPRRDWRCARRSRRSGIEAGDIEILPRTKQKPLRRPACRRRRDGCGWSSGCRRGWAATRCTAWTRMRITGRNALWSRVFPVKTNFCKSKQEQTPGPRPLWLLDPPRRLAEGRVRAAGGARAHRVGLVGRRRGAARLLHRPHRGNLARVDLPGGGREAGSCMATLPEALPAYAELHCLSNFSFLRGASHAGGAGRARGGARLRGARAHRRMLARRHRARACRGQGGKSSS